MACPLGYGDPAKSLYEDKSDPSDDPDGTGRKPNAPPALIEAFKAGAGSKPGKPVRPPGICDPWYIKASSVVVVFFVLAATAHGWLRWFQPDSEYLLLSSAQRFETFTPSFESSSLIWPPLAVHSNRKIILHPALQSWSFDIQSVDQITGQPLALQVIVSLSFGCKRAISTPAGTDGGRFTVPLYGMLEINDRSGNGEPLMVVYELTDPQRFDSPLYEPAPSFHRFNASTLYGLRARVGSEPASPYSFAMLRESSVSAPISYRLTASLATVRFDVSVVPHAGLPLYSYWTNPETNSFVRRQLFDLMYSPFATAASCNGTIARSSRPAEHGASSANGYDSASAVWTLDSNRCTASAASSSSTAQRTKCPDSATNTTIATPTATPTTTAAAAAAAEEVRREFHASTVIPTPTTRHYQSMRAAFTNTTHRLTLAFGSFQHRNSGLLFGRTVTRYLQLSYQNKSVAAAAAAAAGSQDGESITISAVQTNVLNASPQEMSLYADTRIDRVSSSLSSSTNLSDTVRRWLGTFSDRSAVVRFESRQYQIEFGCSLRRQTISPRLPNPHSDRLCAVQHNVLLPLQSVDSCRASAPYKLEPYDCTLSFSALNSAAIEAARLQRQSAITADSTAEEIHRAELMYSMQLSAATTSIVSSVPIEPERVSISHNPSAAP